MPSVPTPQPAEYDFWNQQWGRYVRRGSKGIAIIDTTGDNPRLKYVFDVSDTVTRENSRAVRLWELRPENIDSVTAMLETAERIAAKSDVGSYERFHVVETERGYTIWDDLHDGYYVDDEGVTEELTSEWQAESYLIEVQKTVSDKEVAEWLAVERTNTIPDVSEERREQIVNAMSAAGLHYDEIDSYNGYIVFREDGGNPYTFTEWQEVVDWINGVVFDDPARNEAAERILYPERYEQNNHLPYDIVVERLYIGEPEHDPSNQTRAEIRSEPENFRITDDNFGVGGAKAKFRMNLDAMNTLLQIESGGRSAMPEEQEVLSKYVGWGGLADAFEYSDAAEPRIRR
jgi:hypothetical protein